jgi:hypothetical protein
MDNPTLIIIAVVALFILYKILRRVFRKSIGQKGELAVAKKLKKLPEDKYWVINDLLLHNNGYSSQIDHVVVSQYGVFVIETKNFMGDITGGPNSEMWTQNIYGSKSYFRNPILQNLGHITAIRKVIGDRSHIQFQNIVLFSERARILVDRSLPVYHYRKIVPIIEGFTDEVMSRETALGVYHKLLDSNITDKQMRKEHVTSAKETKKRRDAAVANGKCPRCGGNLVLREGQYGQFYGCSNYPRCKYILNKK